MSRFGLVRLPFGAGGEQDFRLGLREWAAVDEDCGVGPPELLARLGPIARAVSAKLKFADILTAGLLGTWKAQDLRAVFVHGLTGAGKAPTEAGVLVDVVMGAEGLWELAPRAFMIVMAGVAGVPEDTPDPGEPAAAARKPRAPRSRKAASASPT